MMLFTPVLLSVVAWLFVTKALSSSAVLAQLPLEWYCIVVRLQGSSPHLCNVKLKMTVYAGAPYASGSVCRPPRADTTVGFCVPKPWGKTINKAGAGSSYGV